MTAAIIFLSKRGNTLPGVLPLFPTFAIIALLVVGGKNDSSAFRETCLAGIKTIPAYISFVMVCYLSVERLGFKVAIICGLLSWTVTVFMSLYILQRL